MQALSGVNLEIPTGQFTCLLGASGCGKSTLLNLVAGLYRVDQGRVETRNLRVGMVFQEPALFPWLTVRQNIETGLRFRKVPRSRWRSRVDELLHLVHLDDFGDRRPHELSGGMQQRTSLARALAQDAEILLMDEPFGALDAITRSILHDELEDMWFRTGLTILFVTHDVREAVRLGDRVIVMSSRPGTVIADHSIDLPRPRRLESPEVGNLAKTITEQLRLEVRRHGR